MQPDELRAAIAANPTSADERARLIQDAVTNDMAEEIPAEWGVGIDGTPPEGDEDPEILAEQTFSSLDDPDMRLELDGQGDIHMVASQAGRVGSFSFVDIDYFDIYLQWADEVVNNFPDADPFGTRPLDPANGLAGWHTIAQPSTNATIIVGHDHQPDYDTPTSVVVIFGERRYRFDNPRLSQLMDAVEAIKSDAESEFDVEFQPS